MLPHEFPPIEETSLQHQTPSHIEEDRVNSAQEQDEQNLLQTDEESEDDNVTENKIPNGPSASLSAGEKHETESPSILLFSPSKRFLNCWIPTMFVLLLYSIIVIPLRVCFAIPNSAGWYVSDAVIDILFIADILINFRSTYYSEGQEVIDINLIKENYLKTWFWYDLISVLPLDICLIFVTTNRPALFHLNRLLRILRLWDYFEYLDVEIHIHPSLLGASKLVFMALYTSHLVACGWYFLVDYETQAGTVSMDFVIDGFDEDIYGPIDITKQPLILRYARSLFWAIGSMTGYGETLPFTSPELLYVILVSMVGVAVIVSVIGFVGELLANLDLNAQRFRGKVDSMRSFFALRSIRPTLVRQVLNYYEFLWASRGGLNETELLKDLPEYLRTRIILEVNRDIINKVGFLQKCDSAFVERLVIQLRPAIFLPGSYVIREGEIGKEMYFLVNGSIRITSSTGFNLVVNEGAFFGEIALILKSRRSASVRAETYCDCFVLSKEDLDQILKDFEPERRIFEAEANRRRQELLEKNLLVQPHSESLCMSGTEVEETDHEEGGLTTDVEEFDESYRLREQRPLLVDADEEEENMYLQPRRETIQSDVLVPLPGEVSPH